MYRPSGLFWYQAECTPTHQMYTRSLGGLYGLLASQRGVEKFDFVEEMAAASNAAVLSTLLNLSSLPFNILSTDYISDEVIGKIVKLNETADRGLRLSLHEESTDEADEVFLQNPVSKLINTTITSSGANSSFEFRMKPTPPVQVRETNM